MQNISANAIFKSKLKKEPQQDIIIEVPVGDENTSSQDLDIDDVNISLDNDQDIEGSDQAQETPENTGFKSFFSRSDPNKDRILALEAKLDLLAIKLDSLSISTTLRKPIKYSHCWVKSPDFTEPFVPKYSIEDINGMKYVDMQFPKVKFTGLSGFNTMNVMDFLRSMTNAQKKCKLNEEQFLDVVASRTGPPAAHMINRWVDLKLSARSIYTRLYQLYHQIVDPIKSQQYLSNYKIPSNFGFNQILSEIDTLASQAALIAPDENQQKSLQESYAMSNLQKCLPVEAGRHVNELIVKFIQTYGEQPKLEDITEDLIIMTPLLDSEIANAKNFNFDPPRKLGMFPHLNNVNSSTMPTAHDLANGFIKNDNSFDRNGLRANVIQEQQIEDDTSGELDSNSEKMYTNPNSSMQNGSNSAQNGSFSTATRDRFYCCMCGLNSHQSNSPQGCFSMLDDNYKQIRGLAPVEKNCSSCEQKLDLKLKHPIKFCPLRQAMTQGYMSGKIKPKGFFAKYFYENNH